MVGLPAEQTTPDHQNFQVDGLPDDPAQLITGPTGVQPDVATPASPEAPDLEYEGMEEAPDHHARIPEEGDEELPPADREDVAPEQQAAQESQKMVDWEKRYKDLQSYHDKQRTQWQDERTQLATPPEELTQLQALRDVIMSDADLAQQIERKLTGAQTQGTAGQQPAPQQGQLPPRPADYDPYEALDPSTPSGQWHAAYEQAQQSQLLNAIDQRFRQYDQAQLQRQQVQEARRQQLQFRDALNAFVSQPEQGFAEPADRDNFVRFVSEGPKAVFGIERPDLRHLRALYLAMRDSVDNGRQAAPVPVPDLDRKIKAARQAVPPSVTQVPAGEAAPELDERTSFMSGLGSINYGNILGIEGHDRYK